MGRNGSARAAPLCRHYAIHKQLLLSKVLKKRVEEQGWTIILEGGPCLQLRYVLWAKRLHGYIIIKTQFMFPISMQKKLIINMNITFLKQSLKYKL
jgi:hypothetical protein